MGDNVGTYSFDYVPGGAVRIEAEDPLTGRTGFNTGQIDYQDQVVVVDVLAEELGTVTGEVTGNGVAQVGATVKIVSGTYRITTTTDGHGIYVVEGIPYGSIVVSASLGQSFLKRFVYAIDESRKGKLILRPRKK